MSQLYSPLDANSIRLLEIHDDSGLSCSLAPFRLDKAPPFIALSYTWGKAAYQKGRPPDQEYALRINGQKVVTQQNLHDAITTLAKDVREWNGQGYRFWVDFLCINQSDLVERGRQVAMMKSIYEGSAAVLAWLGLPYNEEETSLAMKWMRSFNDHLRRGLEAQNDEIDVVLADIDSSTPGFPSVKDSDEWKAWMGIAEMMESSYWTRTWIYQEATTPREIWFYCGKERFNDIHLSAASTFGTQFSLKCPDFDDHFSTAVGLGSNMSRLASARIQREQGQDRKLLDLVKEVRNTSCSDDRDKIYAALGHAANAGSGRIVPDYTKDVKAVFGDLVRFETTTSITAGLRILECVYIPAPDASNEFLSEVLDPSWPSWIPDWRQKVSLTSFYPADGTQSSLTDPCPGCEIEVDFRGDTMLIKGFTLEHNPIKYLTQICEDGRKIIELTKSWHADLTRNDPSKTTDESIRRSLVADASGMKSEPDGSRRRNRGYIVEWDSIYEGDDMSGRMSSVCLGRRMGQTEGGLLGIFPAAAQKGDVVSVLHGGHLLYLLRPLSDPIDHFRFIGPCYVDGLMDGKAASFGTPPQMLPLV